MRPRSLKCLHGVFALLLLFAGALAVAAAPQERGFPLIQTYEPSLPEASTQFFDATRDSRGILYFGNLSGVLVFDGAWWRRIEVGKGMTAYRVASGEGGKVGVGGVDEIGYLAPDGGGTLRYVSLLPLLPPEQRKLGQVLYIRPIARGFAFMTSRRLLLWDGARVTTLATFPGDRPYAALFSAGSESYVWSREVGISRLQGRGLEPVPGGEVFRGRRVDQILPADGGLLVSVRGEGLFLLRDGKPEPFAPEASRWTAAKRILEGLRLADGRWALGSVLGGLLLLRPDGTVDQVIDTAAGLPDDFVSGLVTDREGSLWLSLNNGLARVEIASPLSILDRRTGLQGETYSVARHRGALWVGGSGGLFTTAGADAGPPARLRPVPGLPPGVWSLLSHGDDLLAGTAFGVFQIRGTTAAMVPGSEQSTTYVLAPSAADPERVWVGQEEGLAAVRREGESWRLTRKIAEFSSEIRSIVEGGDGTVWCGTLLDGVIGVRTDPAAPAKPRLRRVAASEGANLFRIGGRILAVKDKQVLRLDESRGALVKDPALAGVGSQADFSVLAEDAGGDLWMNSHPPAVARRRGAGWEPAPRSLIGVPGRSIEIIFTEPDGVVWLATDKGLIRYEGTARSPAAPLPSPLLARLTSGGALLFGGAPGVTPKTADLPPYLRHLRIEFAPLSFRAGLRYQIRLEPLDANWSAPTAEPFAELTRLPPGEYAFHVRTLGPNGEVGPETGWSFHVRSPWYQTPWALSLWIGAALLAVWGYAWLRGRALRQRAARLEARVSEQTVELRSTVEELRRAHADLGAANARLEELSLRDELTGIANRRRLQQALAEEWSHTRQSIAFVLLDLDFFKLLNDTQGHLAGDLCLQSVASLLSAAARRNGGLAARYGGEEFAVLLPGIGLAGALKVAEQLREGIEALAIPNEAAPLKRVTASFGVVALTPAPGQRHEDLIESADLALYRAKAEGKNRVCAGGVRSEAGGERTSPAA